MIITMMVVMPVMNMRMALAAIVMMPVISSS